MPLPIRESFKASLPNLYRIGHVVACINEQTGGPALSVTRLAQGLSNLDTLCHLFTLDYAYLGKQIIPANVECHSFPAQVHTRLLRGFSPTLRKYLQTCVGQLDVIHNHGLWMLPNLYARLASQQHRVPLVISPRGMLESWSMRRARWKKTLAWHAYEHQNLANAHLFHATSKAEAQSIRSLGFRQPIALIPNGVDMPSPKLDGKVLRHRLVAHHRELADRRWLLFLSRLHPKKGLPQLIQCWSKLAKTFPDWQLVIAGPDHEGHQSQLQAQALQLGLQNRITFTGMLSGEDKAAAFANSELFVLPSHSENFGIAIAEALSYGVPVIATEGTPWQELNDQECGWWIENSESALLGALQEGFLLSHASRMTMGQRGRQLVEEKYSWATVAEQMRQAYHWLLAGGMSPPSVITSLAIER